jgi:NAD(P)H-hydrate epimerase
VSGLHPPLRPYARLHVPAATGKESAEFDRHAIDELGVPQQVLMENAGRAAAAILDRLYPRGPVVALVGAGNNGGDALVALRTLAAWGRDVRAVFVADRAGPETVLHAWEVPTVKDGDLDEAAWREVLGAAAVVVDGILGTGVQGAPRERQARAIGRLAAAGRPVLAMDIPSGVDAANGAVPGSAVRADVTVSFGAPKLGCLLHPGRARSGRVIAVEIGFPPMPVTAASAAMTTPAWVQARLPGRELDTHKNAVGRLVVVAGQPGMAGAAILCVRAGLRAGAGLVQVCSAPENREVIQGAVPEAIFLDADDVGALDQALDRASAVAVGPGLGTGAGSEALLARALRAGTAPVVVDADGLNLLAESRGGSAREVAKRRPLLLTPHPGEMGRLRELSAEEIAADRVAVVRAAAEELGCAVVLKGAPSLVAAPGLPVQVDTQGSSDLAAAGMGDVLTGVCGGLLAQGLGSRDAGAVALYLSGRASVLAGRGRSLTPSDVVRWLPEALAERGAGADRLGLPFVTLDLDAPR